MGARGRRGLVVALLLAGLAAGAAAQDVPPRPPRAEGLVIDRVGLLTPAERADLDRRLRAFEDTTTVQIAVVILPDLGGADPALFATELGRRWGVGQAGFDNGLVVLVSVGTREVFIATGYGLEGAVPDALASRVVRDVIVPAFRRGDFHGGLARALDVLMAAAAGEPRAAERALPRDGGGAATLALLLILIVLLVLASQAMRTGGGGGGAVRARRSGVPPVIVVPGGWGGGWGGGGFGGGGFGGGWGGFGGGSFGGGGAGGRW